MNITLAQKSLTPEQSTEILFWLAVIVVFAMVVGIAGWLIYRRLRKSGEPEPDDGGLTLSDMRRLYEAGEMSHEEYQSVRQKIIGKTQAAFHATGGVAAPPQAAPAAKDPPADEPPALPPPAPPPAPDANTTNEQKDTPGPT